ncbi:DUF5060 domain-containing protein [Candidatus Dojkabacteria bacterium]|uniref:DUF5060 domain-containing protein n=1 Tax=Candidatus Dojkabacteria bacterium TaxID=2099670 RepID=A0A955KXI4_9BACT|nr:DUF5060 domain-containing protein [Candidatus Dojkabacteria bacterium]
MFSKRSKNKFKDIRSDHSNSASRSPIASLDLSGGSLGRRKIMRSLPKAIFGLVLLLGGVIIINVLLNYDFVGLGDSKASGGAVSGDLVKWHTVTIDFQGPNLSEVQSDPNPFLDFRLNVQFKAPSGKTYNIPGFFAGDGNGGGSGKVWRARFTPGESGNWEYTASFRSGPQVAIDLSPTAGVSDSFDGQTGSFNIAPLDTNAKGFRSMGRLEYVGLYYLKFADGPYWLKGGIDSPENFLGYKGFDNTVDQGGIIPNFVHEYSTHVADFQQGDPLFTSADTGYDSKGIIGALNYLSSKHVNSIYFLPMNLGGDGQETYPFVSPNDKTHYDISKLDQWHTVFEHATSKQIALHFVLNEQEEGNRNWLDGGTLGIERKLYYRELIARFGHNLALKWNISEENRFDTNTTIQFAQYINDLDEYDHPIAAHTHPNDFTQYEQLKGNPNFTATSIQYDVNQASSHVESWRQKSLESGQVWVIDMDENNPAGVGLTNQNASELRKRALYDIYFSGGNLEWYFGYHDLPLGGDMRTEDFRTREEMYNYMWYARKFMQDNLPFWEMGPIDGLVDGENNSVGSAQVLAKPGSIYAVYFPSSNDADDRTNGFLDLSNASGNFTLKWYNPRTGNFEGTESSMTGGSKQTIPPAPSDFGNDWVLLVTDGSYTPGQGIDPVPTPEPGGDPAYIANNGLIVIEVEKLNYTDGWNEETLIPGYTGQGYLHWVGGDFFSTPGNGLIEIPIWIEEAGTYNLRLRNFHDHPDASEENDVWIKIDEGRWVKTFSSAKDEWTWNTSYEFSEDNKVPASDQLSAGRHVVYFSGRANGFRIDRMHMYLDSVPDALNLSLPESTFATPGGGTGPAECNITAQLECNYELDDPPALNVAWKITNDNIEFGSEQNSGKIVVRINNIEDGWFTEGSDYWWASNYQEFANTGKDFRDADWNYNILPDTIYRAWVSVYAKDDPDNIVCVTDELPIACESQDDPVDPPVDDPPDDPIEPPDVPIDPPVVVDDPTGSPADDPTGDPSVTDYPYQDTTNNNTYYVDPTTYQYYQTSNLPTTALSSAQKRFVIGSIMLILGSTLFFFPKIRSVIFKKNSTMRESV